MNQSFSTRNSFITTKVSSAITAVLWLVLAGTTAMADWPNANQTKYYQPPDLTPTSYNILAAQPPAGIVPNVPIILADDFPCTQPGAITDIHIWASWLGDTATMIIPDMPITLGFWSDVPATPGNPSHPDIMLWSQTFQPGGAIPGHYKRVVGTPGWTPSQFWDPDPPSLGQILGNDNINWQYNFYPDPSQPNGLFVQAGTATTPTNYWLSVSAGTNVVAFGWRTSAAHNGDDAVFGHTDSTGINLVGAWQKLDDPQVFSHPQSLDLAFAITTTPQPAILPPPPGKWAQWPDLFSGFGLDVNATSPNAANGLWTLADDFQCTVAGPITNIQLWASFQGDAPPSGQSFVLSIWNDLPVTATPFSQPSPGPPYWTQTFNPGDYTVTPAGTGTEHFYDPNTGLLASENNVWLYSFNVPATHPLCQQGQGKIYWVSVAAISPPAGTPQWGWKTSTNHWNDAGVLGKVDPISGNMLVPWQPLFNPLPGTPVNNIDFAFQINSGPPSADCDPALSGVIQQPDTSNNGLDVWALAPTIVGDDFPCRIQGPIAGLSIWGSWLGDRVDTNALFQVMLWSDQPAAVGQIPFSHPLSVICSNVFYAPQFPAGPLRYRYSLVQSGVQENFYNPNPPFSGLVGTDTNIWRYDFFPPIGSCFFQDGGPFANNKFYWVTVSYLPGTLGNVNSNVFGWKTSTRHFQDAAVFGTNGINWTPLFDPRNGTQLDLAKVVWKGRVIGKNEDIYNLTSTNADGIQLILQGVHLITWDYDGFPAWQFVTYFTNIGVNTYTVLQWYGQTLPPGGLTHVGYMTLGTVLPTIFSQNWLNGTNVIGPIVQQNYHLVGDPTAVELNDFYPGTIMVGPGSVEYYIIPPPLDQMIVGGVRNPMATDTLPSSGLMMPGGAAVNPVRESPSKAQYAMFIIPLQVGGNPGALDFVLLPLDTALVPAIQSVSLSGGNVIIHLDSDVGHSYQLQSSLSITNPFPWKNEGSPVMATGPDTILTAPVGGAVNFYRVMLMP